MVNASVEKGQGIQEKIGFDFIGNRNFTFVLSVVLIVVGIGSMVVKGGLNFGIDFAGGTLVEVRFSDVPETEDIRNAVNAIGFEDSIIQRLGDGQIVLIRVQNPETSEILSRLQKSGYINDLTIEIDDKLINEDMSKSDKISILIKEKEYLIQLFNI